MKFELFLLVIVGLIAVSVAVDGDSSSSEEVDNDNDDLPSILGMLGSKVAAADNWDVQYDDESDDAKSTKARLTTEAPAAPCCIPNVWQGRVYADFGFAPIGGRPRSGFDDNDDRRGGGRPTVSHSLDQVYVDGNNQRLAGNLLEFHGRPKVLNISYIFQVGANQTADLYLFSRTAQKCRHRQMKNAVWRRQCIPVNATSGGQYSLGPTAGGLTVQSWMFRGASKRVDAVLAGADDDVNDHTTTPRPRPRPRPRMWLAANVLVVPNSCIPVLVQEEGSVFSGGRSRDDVDVNDDDDNDDDDNSDQYFGFKPRPSPRPRPRPRPQPRGEAFVGSAYFSGLQTTITDPSVFNVPSYCSKTANTLYYDEMEDEIPTVLERFILM